MIISRFFNEFIMFSLGGWVYESIYCTIQKKHWQNRGFLFGPVCPIYGFGAMMIRLFAVCLSLLPAKVSTKDVPLWALFLGFMVISAVLEYITSWGMEKIFHARWWDYSNMPLNLNGRICLPASLLFGFAGTIGWVYIIPLLPAAHSVANSLPVEAASLLLMGIFAADLAISVESTRHLIEKLEAKEEVFNDAAEKGVLKIRSIPKRMHNAEEKVKGMTKSLAPHFIHTIENPSEQFKQFKLKLSGDESSMLNRIRSYHPVNGFKKEKNDND